MRNIRYRLVSSKDDKDQEIHKTYYDEFDRHMELIIKQRHNNSNWGDGFSSSCGFEDKWVLEKAGLYKERWLTEEEVFIIML